ncbi:MAG TPA: YecR family lipoprotein [Steroidobacteraceae bacterium]
MIRLITAALAVLIAGCTTYKLWNVADSDRDTATVALFYEYRKFESPQVDERAGVEMARERCRDWGYPSAHRKGEDRQCIDGVESSCKKWRVVREYRCAQKDK